MSNLARKMGSPSIVPTDQSDSGLPNTSSDFGTIARAVLGKDAGLRLRLLTGYCERTCYRYASGEREPPFHFIFRLLASDAGQPFFVALMHDNNARWWRDYERAHRVGEAAMRAAAE
jgi:hypothetical protein